MIGRFTDAAVTLYDKLDDLVTAQQVWSEKQFGPARERDARGPLDHLKKECGELFDLIEQWNAGKLPPERTGEIDKEIADVTLLYLDLLWRTGRKFGAAVDAALAKMRENVKREWPPHSPWVWNPVCENPSETFDGKALMRYTVTAHNQVTKAQGQSTVIGQGDTPEAATEDAYRQIRNLNASAVEHVRENPPTEEEMVRLAAEELGAVHLRMPREKIPLVAAPDSEHYKCPTCDMECLVGILSTGPDRPIPMCPTCKVDMRPV